MKPPADHRAHVQAIGNRAMLTFTALGIVLVALMIVPLIRRDRPVARY